MGIYEQFGVTPIINLWGTATRLGGALLAPGVAEAMTQAATQSVKIDELQAAASGIIAQLTGAQAGYVTCGACSGLTLGTAACLAGLDPARMGQLPDTSSMPDEVIMARDQRCGYDHAIRAAGARIIDVGLNEALTGSMRPIEAWEFQAAITERTAAIALMPYVWNAKKESFIKDVIATAKKHNIPVLVDAAASVPPLDNFKRFIALGADLVAYSGGKALRGPQGTGILCGRADLIASVALQHLDMGGYSDMWEPPESLIPRNKLTGQPRQGIGRCQKVSREEIVGLLFRLRQLTKQKTIEEAQQMQALLQCIADHLHDLPHVTTAIKHPASERTGAVPSLEVKLDPVGLARTTAQVSTELKNGHPRLWVNEKSLPDDILIITALNLDQKLSDIVGKRIRDVLTGA